jgi:hypothetical protein
VVDIAPAAAAADLLEMVMTPDLLILFRIKVSPLGMEDWVAITMGLLVVDSVDSVVVLAAA